jgi:hypothetical protein
MERNTVAKFESKIEEVMKLMVSHRGPISNPIAVSRHDEPVRLLNEKHVP